jgi:hypothetical protein
MRDFLRHLVGGAPRIFAREPSHRSLIQLRQLRKLNSVNLPAPAFDIGQRTPWDAKFLRHIVLLETYILASFLKALTQHLTVCIG